MCYSRNGKKDSSTQTNPKTKLTCCQRCRRFFYKRIKRRINKKVFGVANPNLSEYEVTDIDLGNINSKFKLSDTGSLLTLFKKALDIKDSNWNTSIKNIDLIEDVSFGELKKKYSIKGSKEKILKNMINDYRRGRLSQSQIQKSKYNLRKLDKEQLHNMLNDYETAQRNKYADLNAKELKKKFIVKKSQEKVLDKLIDDYKTGKLSATALSNMHGIDAKKLDQNKLNNMLQKYENSPTFVARKFSLKSSQEKVLEKFMEDHRNGKVSATKFTSKGGFDSNKLNKTQLYAILNKYEAEQNSKSLFAKSNSKYKNLMEDFKSLKNYQSLIDQAKKRVSFALSKNKQYSKLIKK